jgi:pimeloyl-[acyl-carrier protein] methyl ester esterase
MSKAIDSHWILLRGLAREARHWRDFPQLIEEEVLETTGKRAIVSCIDLPGSGRFSEMKCPLSVPAMAEFVREKYVEIRDRLNSEGERPEHVYLVSLSLGGMIASSWLQRWPRDFDGAVMMNTSFRGFSSFHHRLRPQSLKHLVAILRTVKDPVECERHVLQMVSNRAEIHEEVAKEWAKIAMDRPVTVENFVRQLTAAGLYRASKTRPAVPLLLLSSEKDRMVNPRCSRAIARRWRCEMREHPEAGHDLTVDDAQWVAREIVQWGEKIK